MSAVAVEPDFAPFKHNFHPQLSLKLACNAVGKTVLSHRYMAYPLSVSPVFRLEETERAESGHPSLANRAYLYRMNMSPGLLAGDEIGMSLKLAPEAQLYLADQSATKVHRMPEQIPDLISGESPQKISQAVVNYCFELGDRATLEFLPEPLILFAESALVQKTEIILHPTAALTLGEIVLPGRLARGEIYQFREYLSRLQVRSPEGTVWFAETMKLRGKNNRFAQVALFASGTVLGSLVLILPAAVATPENLQTLSLAIDALVKADNSVDLASSVLPEGRGLFIRAMAQTTREMQGCFRSVVNCVRSLRGQLPLPYSV